MSNNLILVFDTETSGLWPKNNESKNPEDYPSIKYNFLSSQLDRDTLVAGVKLIRKLMQS